MQQEINETRHQKGLADVLRPVESTIRMYFKQISIKLMVMLINLR